MVLPDSAGWGFGFLAMKWLKRTAEGFSPGNGGKPPRPERAAEGVPARRSLSPTSTTPSLRVAGFEDEDDDEYENEAPGEGGSSFFIAPGVETPG